MRRSEASVLLLFAALWLAALVRLPVLEDEAYYWTWSRALSLHYYDHPPLIAGLIRAAQAATGNATIALRLVSAACAFITVVFTLATCRCLASAATASITGERAPISSMAPAAVSAGAWAMAASLSMSVVLLPATPDAPLSAALAVAAYATTRAMSPGSERWAVVAAVMFGIAIFAKLPAVLAAAGVWGGALTSTAGRRAIHRPTVMGVALVVVGAMVGWWSSSPSTPTAITFQMQRVTSGAGRPWVALPLAVGALMLVVGVAVTGAWFIQLRNPTRLSPASRALMGGVGAVFVACLAATALGSGELNWLLPCAVLGVPVAASTFDKDHHQWFRWVARAQAALTAAVLVHIVQPVWPLPAPRDRTLRSAGWSAVAAEVDRQMRHHRGTIVVTHTYQQASLLRFHLADRWPVQVRDARRRSQYDAWPHRPIPPDARVVMVASNGRRQKRLQNATALVAPPVWVARARAGRRVASTLVATTCGDPFAPRSRCAR